LKAYNYLSKIPFLKKSFSLKIIVVAFIGIHVPLFGIIGYLLNSQLASESAWSIAIFTLVMTLGATGITLLILNKLLKPVLRAKEALEQYKEYSKIPNLPTHYSDEGGILMREVQKTIEAMSNIEEERKNLIHILRHDLQGPINNSLGILELLKTDSLDKEAIESLQSNFIDQRERLLTSIDYIKSQRNLEDHKKSLEDIEITDLISQTINNKSIEADYRNISFEINDRVNQKISLPKVILDRVISNLLDNAIKHSEKGGKVIISSEMDEDILRIKIEDRGKGIPEDILSSLFKLNDKTSEDYDPNKPSMGLGLYLCQKLMNSVGGKITAGNNNAEDGAYFTVEYILHENTVLT